MLVLPAGRMYWRQCSRSRSTANRLANPLTQPKAKKNTYMMLPETLSCPLIKALCALSLPEARATMSSSESLSVTSALLGAAPVPTAPAPFLRSM